MRRCSLRGCPFGSTEWIEETAERTGTHCRPEVRPKAPTETDRPKTTPIPLDFP